MIEASRSKPLLDALDSHIAVLDRNGVIVEVNAAWRAFGDQNGLRMPQHAVGNSYLEVCGAARGAYSEGAREVARGLESVMQGKRQDFTSEYPCHGPRQRRWFRLHAASAPGDAGGCVVAHQDISSYRLRTQGLRADHAAVLQRALGKVAHRYNNLMQVVLGFGYLLRDQTSPEAAAQREYLDQIMEAAEQGGRLGAKLVAFCGKELIQPRVVDLNQLAQRTHERLLSVVAEGVDLQLRLTPYAGVVVADPLHIGRALDEVLHNALDAVSGGGTVTISTALEKVDYLSWERYPLLPAGEYVSLAVEDSGAGMSAEVLEHAIEPFFSTGLTRTGMGLAVAYGLVRQNGGFLIVESASGAGTRCKLLLPREDVAWWEEGAVRL